MYSLHRWLDTVELTLVIVLMLALIVINHLQEILHFYGIKSKHIVISTLCKNIPYKKKLLPACMMTKYTYNRFNSITKSDKQSQQQQQQNSVSSYSPLSAHSDIEEMCPSTITKSRRFIYYQYPKTPPMQPSLTVCGNTAHGYDSNKLGDQYHLPPIILPRSPWHSSVERQFFCLQFYNTNSV
jgi:hypothetical protein